MGRQEGEGGIVVERWEIFRVVKIWKFGEDMNINFDYQILRYDRGRMRFRMDVQGQCFVKILKWIWRFVILRF